MGWSPPIRRLTDKAAARADAVVRKATLDIFAAVVRRSPVDTGRFRSNWNVSYNTVDTTVTASVDAARADNEVRKVLTLPVGGVVALANSMPYAIRLEYGWSKQAPAGMVRVSTAEWPAILRGAATTKRG